MKRRRGPSVKPWNKVPRMEKFWVPSVYLDQNGVNQIILTTQPQYIQYYTGEQLTAKSKSSGIVASDERALQHAKLWRFQGAVWCWLDPNTGDRQPTGGDDGSSEFGLDVRTNVEMLTYIWLKLSETAATPTLNSPPLPALLDPRPAFELANLLTRDDIISWGTIPVFGISARQYTALFGTGFSSLQAQALNAGQYAQSHVARIPWPRVPKLGFNLKKGEGLACLAGRWPGPGSASNNPNDDQSGDVRGIITCDVSRVLVSI